MTTKTNVSGFKRKPTVNAVVANDIKGKIDEIVEVKSKRSKEIVFPDNYKTVVDEAKLNMKDGFKKVEAAEEVYKSLKGNERRVIISAFIEGVGLTKAGSATYYNNIRNKEKQPTK